MKKTGFSLVIITVILAVSACSGPGAMGGGGTETGTITINFSGSARAVWPPSDENGLLSELEHRVKLEGARETKTKVLDNGETSVNFTVAPGTWKVTAESWLDDIQAASGSNSVDVVAGQTSAVSILMKKTTDYSFLTVANINEWNEAVNEISQKAGKYIIIVTSDISMQGVSASPNAPAYTFGNASGIEVIVRGKYDSKFSGGKCHPTLRLNGDGNSLLRVGQGQSVVLQDIYLEGNSTSRLVDISGNLTMKGVGGVFNNTMGGGVIVQQNGSFTMQGDTQVSGNVVDADAVWGGGGVYVYGTFTMKDCASVSGNTAEKDNRAERGFGGGVYVAGGTFTMQGSSSVSGNEAQGSNGLGGGGVYVAGGTFTMQGSSSVSGNTGVNGGGVVVPSGTFTMQGSSSVSKNTAGNGGGVHVGEGSFIMQSSSSVSENTANSGGGVYISNNSAGSVGRGSFTMQGNASISGNTANNFGGGLYVEKGTYRIEGGTIYGNDSTMKNTATEGGAALYIDWEDYGSIMVKGAVLYGTGDASIPLDPPNHYSREATIKVVNGELVSP